MAYPLAVVQLESIVLTGEYGKIQHGEVRIDDTGGDDWRRGCTMVCNRTNVHVYVKEVGAPFPRAIASGASSVHEFAKNDDPYQRGASATTAELPGGRGRKLIGARLFAGRHKSDHALQVVPGNPDRAAEACFPTWA